MLPKVFMSRCAEISALIQGTSVSSSAYSALHDYLLHPSDPRSIQVFFEFLSATEIKPVILNGKSRSKTRFTETDLRNLKIIAYNGEKEPPAISMLSHTGKCPSETKDPVTLNYAAQALLRARFFLYFPWKLYHNPYCGE